MPRKWRVLADSSRYWLLDVSRDKTVAFEGDVSTFVEDSDPLRGRWTTLEACPYVPAELLLTDNRISELDRL